MFLLNVLTHQACVSTWLWVFFWLCRHMKHVCRPVYEFPSECVDTSYMRVDLSLNFSLTVSILPTCVSTQLEEFSKTSRHTCRICRHSKKKSQRQVDTHARYVDIVRRSIKDRLTHMQHVLTQLEGYVENRTTHKLFVSTQLAEIS